MSAVDRVADALARAGVDPGVPPVGHARQIDTVVDEDLLRYDMVWAAAGTPRAVFAIAPDRLVAVSGARVARVSPGT